MFHLQHLPNHRPGEKTVLFLRRHWIAVFRLVGFTAIAAIAPIGLLWLLSELFPTLLVVPTSNAIATVFISIYYLAVVTFFFQEFIDYYLDTWVVTTERIINIEQHGLFHRVASEMHLAMVQDVTATVRGALRTFLDYGDVHIHSAGPIQQFRFRDIANPERVRQVVQQLTEDDKHRHPSAYGPNH
ncbi:hypothetical protein A3C17_01015 [Candidatus Uhrbacteria bacterium RIFCSPHIGHO2_02_FULL_53_13]|uniref:YdbS-like PH domain-containing protein n=2 Tax=Candidatus Uhriibacteriota TaxID=1752732 RepID=A0A1F7U111_9BACT|nr:MAG: hypothetical protein A3C17_01015 [Candidatus Uhrbacteria bacterium RIFCSPHIGHO2_02_FULL_53_13]OGL89655.1 MAG: hypothetical protein A3I45_03710 [Candidatus Uhrbacteria bacterium RIFCSPLOWO2_02_FULL_53_10]